MSKVFLEDRLYETWNYGHTVLIGDGKQTLSAFLPLPPTDFAKHAQLITEHKKGKILTNAISISFGAVPSLLAAHRMLPSSGQGPVCAMLDAVVLANCLYELTSVTPETISQALEEYKVERMPHVKAMYARSKRNARVLFGNVRASRPTTKLIAFQKKKF